MKPDCGKFEKYWSATGLVGRALTELMSFLEGKSLEPPFVDESVLKALDAETRVVKLGNVIYVEGNVMRASLEYLKSKK